MRLGLIGFNQLKDLHPLWKRITPQAVADINADKIPNLAIKHFKHLKKPETLRSLSSLHLVHLTKEQLILRDDFKLIYVIAVLTLGVVACIVSLIAYLFIPCVGLHSYKAQKKFRAILLPNIHRVKHVFTEYIPAARAA